jgi:hypothetical protein
MIAIYAAQPIRVFDSDKADKDPIRGRHEQSASSLFFMTAHVVVVTSKPVRRPGPARAHGLRVVVVVVVAQQRQQYHVFFSAFASWTTNTPRRFDGLRTQP